jgi:hypothetical protein
VPTDEAALALAAYRGVCAEIDRAERELDALRKRRHEAFAAYRKVAPKIGRP